MKARKGRDDGLPGKTIRVVTGVGGATVTRRAAGLVVDGSLTRLEGEPPVATSGGWGDVPRRR